MCDTICKLPRGIIPVVQTPFTLNMNIDEPSLRRLLSDSISAGATGLLLPVVASEVSELSFDERDLIVDIAVSEIGGSLPIIVGASGNNVSHCRSIATKALQVGAAGYLVAVPSMLYGRAGRDVVAFFKDVSKDFDLLPMIIQDFRENDFGLDIDTMKALRDEVPSLAGFKIETLPAGPKFTMIRKAFGDSTFIAGGWSVPQFIEAMDRGIDAMIPECSMVRVYSHIWKLHQSGKRTDARNLFNQLLPVLAFSNQDLATSITFFKRLLYRKGIFTTDHVRLHPLAWDEFSDQISRELITTYLRIEKAIAT